jgi:hypothetical protein
LPNTEYTYEFSTTSDQGLVSTETKTITTMGELGFSVLYTAIDSICINVYGTYSGFAVYAGETPDTMEIIATKSGVFAPSKLPLSMLYYYPLNVDLYDYSDGVGKTADSNYVAAAANGARITTDDTIVGIGSLALSSREMQYISLPPVSNSGASEMTLSCWFKSNSSGVGAKLFDFGSSSGGGYRRWYMCMNELLENGNTTIYYCYEDDNENINTTQLVIPTNYNNGEWTHIAIVMDSAAQTWNVYINSSLIATQTGALFPVLQENYYNYIGKSFVASDEYFNGAVEDFRIYSKTLSQAEIHNIYNMSSYKFVFKVPRENTTYYIKLAPQNGAGEYGEPTSAQIVTMAASM